MRLSIWCYLLLLSAANAKDWVSTVAKYVKKYGNVNHVMLMTNQDNLGVETNKVARTFGRHFPVSTFSTKRLNSPVSRKLVSKRATLYVLLDFDKSGTSFEKALDLARYNQNEFSKLLLVQYDPHDNVTVKYGGFLSQAWDYGVFASIIEVNDKRRYPVAYSVIPKDKQRMKNSEIEEVKRSITQKRGELAFYRNESTSLALRPDAPLHISSDLSSMMINKELLASQYLPAKERTKLLILRLKETGLYDHWIRSNKEVEGIKRKELRNKKKRDRLRIDVHRELYYSLFVFIYAGFVLMAGFLYRKELAKRFGREIRAIYVFLRVLWNLNGKKETRLLKLKKLN